MCLIRLAALTLVTPDADPDDVVARGPVEPRRMYVSQISEAVSNNVPLDSCAYVTDSCRYFKQINVVNEG